MNPAPETSQLMTRREAVTRLAWLMGGTIVGAELFLNGTRLRATEVSATFSAADLALLDEIAETIIPATTSPGAKAAQVGAFMTLMANDCYDDAHQSAFRAGLKAVDDAARAQGGKSFVELAPADRTALLNKLDSEAKGRPRPPHGVPPHYFVLMKQLAILGYFTSEIGCTQAIRYIEVPGAFHGDVPYKKGDPAWFSKPSTHLL